MNNGVSRSALSFPDKVKSMTGEQRTNAPRWAVLAAFAAIYLIWGSIYLAIRFALETIPPFLLAGSRFTSAGLLMFGWALGRGEPLPRRIHWRSAALIGGMLFLLNNGALSWAMQVVPSGLSALLLAAIPLCVALLDWVTGGARPTAMVGAGLVLGFMGVALLANTGAASGGPEMAAGIAALLFAAFAWSCGTVYGRRAPQASSPIMATGMQLLCGGLLLLALSGLSGEWPRFDPAGVDLRSMASWGYLVLFGSIIGFGSYVWLLRVTTPARLSTYAYVNPVVAVFLGWALAGETVTLQTLVAAAIIIGAVMLINVARTKRAAPAATPALAPNPAASGCD